MATYYVDMAVGADVNNGLAEGAGNAWQTIDHAMNQVAAADKVWVKASADYTELATIDTAGGAATPIVFEGYTAATGDGGRAVIDAGGVRAQCIINSVGVGVATHYVFKNFHMENATGESFNTSGEYITFKNCKFGTSAAGGGVNCRSVMFEGCDFEVPGNGVTVSGGTGLILIGCTFKGGARGINALGYPVVAIDCTFFSASSENIKAGGAGIPLVVVNCTIDGDNEDSNHGIYVDNTATLMAIVNTVAYDCATGMDNNAGDMGEVVISRNNCVNSNTANYNNMATFTGEVVAAPNFVNEVAGADYTPDTGSPLIEAGYDIGGDIDIGAVQLPAGAGGGGIVVHPGMSGGMRG